MKYLKKFWRWLKRNWKYIASGLGILLVASVGVAYRRNSKKAQVLKHKLNIKRAEREIGRLEGKREMIRKSENAAEADLEIIDAEVKKLDEKITVSREEVDRLSSKEKLEEFKRLGY